MPAPAPPATHAIPAPVLGRSDIVVTRPSTPVERASMQEPSNGPAGPKVEEAPVPRETLGPPPPPPQADQLPDAIVIRLIESGRAAFVRCFKKAVEADPTELSFKVRLHVELDGNGAITATATDAANQTLDGCLGRAARWLKYPASGRPVVVEMPLFYRAE